MYNEKVKEYLDTYLDKHREKVYEYHREWFKNKYESDVEFREKDNQRCLTRYHTDIEFKAKANKRRYETYKEKMKDPEYREQMISKRKAYYEKKKQEKLQTAKA